jgi:hypothetical protein
MMRMIGIDAENESDSSNASMLSDDQNAFHEENKINEILVNAKVIKVKSNTETREVLLRLIGSCNNPLPKLILSVVGGSANKLTIDKDIKSAFKLGLMKAAKTTDAWILTGGLNSGVMKLVGDAVAQDFDNENVTVVGIVPCGCIPKHHVLFDKDLINSDELVQNSECLINVNKEDNQVNMVSLSLNPNHTHFIFVDDDTVGQFGAEVVFRTKFEEDLKHFPYFMSTDVADVGFTNINSHVNVPMVFIVVEGDLDTLFKINNALNSKTPVVLIAV